MLGPCSVAPSGAAGCGFPVPQGSRVCIATSKRRFPHPYSIFKFVGATRFKRFSKKYNLWRSRLRHRLSRPGLLSGAPFRGSILRAVKHPSRRIFIC
jgi:hypothetical protein